MTGGVPPGPLARLCLVFSEIGGKVIRLGSPPSPPSPGGVVGDIGAGMGGRLGSQGAGGGGHTVLGGLEPLIEGSFGACTLSEGGRLDLGSSALYRGVSNPSGALCVLDVDGRGLEDSGPGQGCRILTTGGLAAGRFCRSTVSPSSLTFKMPTVSAPCPFLWSEQVRSKASSWS